MEPSLRKVLIDSHVAVVAIAVLFFYSFFSVARAVFALWTPALEVVFFLATAIAIRGIPYTSRTLDPLTRLYLLTTFSNILFALAYLAAAWLLSCWVYGTGPLRSLGNYRNKFSRKTDA